MPEITTTENNTTTHVVEYHPNELLQILGKDARKLVAKDVKGAIAAILNFKEVKNQYGGPQTRVTITFIIDHSKPDSFPFSDDEATQASLGDEGDALGYRDQ